MKALDPNGPSAWELLLAQDGSKAKSPPKWLTPSNNVPPSTPTNPTNQQQQPSSTNDNHPTPINDPNKP